MKIARILRFQHTIFAGIRICCTYVFTLDELERRNAVHSYIMENSKQTLLTANSQCSGKAKDVINKFK